MGSIDSVADQLLDRLAALVMGPAIGRVTVSGTAIVRGTVGVLPDKRLVRVRSPQRVVTGSQVDVRLQELAPTAAAGAFVRVPAGTTVTWRSPPEGLGATGTVVADFAPAPTALELHVTSITRASELRDSVDAYKCHADGTIALVLIDPEVRGRTVAMDGSAVATATWRVLVLSRSLDGQKDRRASASRLYDPLMSALVGKRAGADVVRFVSWSRASVKDAESWAFAITTELHFTPTSDVDGVPFTQFSGTTDGANSADPVSSLVDIPQ